MIIEFRKFIKNQKLWGSQSKLLLAVSGGVDSVTLVDLCLKLNLNFGIAHCNFSLRGDESDADEAFVRQLAADIDVPFFSICFNTKEDAENMGISVQMAARKLRYDWFEGIAAGKGFSHIVTAHHLDDQIETFFINLLRGSGLNGLHGIPVKKGKVVRPLLFATRQQIHDYASENHLTWREDSSNLTDKYLRNKIRHQIIPVLSEMNPAFRDIMSETFYRLKEVNNIFKQKIEEGHADLVEVTETETRILLSWLDEFGNHATWLYELLKPFGFNFTVVKEIVQSLNGQSGKIFLSSTHRLVKDREHLIITRLDKDESTSENPIYVFEETRSLESPLKIKFEVLDYDKLTIIKESKHAFIDLKKLSFPLKLRKWKPGDRFIPLGMKNSKKLSDFFINEKLSISEKENVWLLLSDDKVVWVAGLRIDNRFKITGNTRKVLHISLDLPEPEEDTVFRKFSQILW